MAYTLVKFRPLNMDVGPTFKTKDEADAYAQNMEYYENHEAINVVCWIEDFESVDRGVFMIRTDLNHEVSFVVAEETEDPTDTMETFVGTRIIENQRRKEKINPCGNYHPLPCGLDKDCPVPVDTFDPKEDSESIYTKYVDSLCDI